MENTKTQSYLKRQNEIYIQRTLEFILLKIATNGLFFDKIL